MAGGDGGQKGRPKKLIAAAERWARRDGGDDGEPLAENLRAWGYTEERIAELTAQTQAAAEPDLLIWPENWEAVGLFCALATQWRLAGGMGISYQGLDYVAILATLQLQRVPPRDWPDLFWRIRVMEAAAVPILNERIRKSTHGQ